jgi:TRAP-type uncharacterized transport system substrate-binding protein
MVAAVGIVGLLAGAVAYAWTQHPSLFSFSYNLKLATGPIGSDGQKLLATFTREVAAERPRVRLIPVETNSLRLSGKALTDGQVDLAVVRSDDEAAAQGRTIFLIQRIGVAILLPPKSEIETISGLVGKKLAVAKGAHFDSGLLRALTEFYGLREVDLTEVPLPQVGAALKVKRVAAVIVFGPLGPGDTTATFASIRKSFKEKPTFLDISEADAIAARWPAYESVEIKQGTFGGAPPEPEEAINTFAVSVRLVSRASLPDRVAGELTRLLINTKAKLLTTLPAVGQMEPPDTEKTSVLPVHPGTLAYLNGEQTSLLDETLNYYWLAGIVFAILAPLVGWIKAKSGLRRRDEARAKLFRVVELVRLLKVGSADQLAIADEEIEQMTEWLFERLAEGDIERDHFQCIERMISQLRGATERRRADLSSASGKIAVAA